MAELSIVTANTTEAAVSKAAGRPALRRPRGVTEGLQDARFTNLSGGCASEDGGHGLTTNVAVRFDRSRFPPIQAAEIEGPGADRWGARGSAALPFGTLFPTAEHLLLWARDRIVCGSAYDYPLAADRPDGYRSPGGQLARVADPTPVAQLAISSAFAVAGTPSAWDPRLPDREPPAPLTDAIRKSLDFIFLNHWRAAVAEIEALDLGLVPSRQAPTHGWTVPARAARLRADLVQMTMTGASSELPVAQGRVVRRRRR